MNVYGKTDIGKVRQENQDTFAYGKPSENTCFAFVCDGMGGQNGGNIASQITRDILVERFFRGLNQKLTQDIARKIIYDAYENANNVIINKSIVDSTLKGMGTTVVGAIVADDDLWIGHVGDSRAYLYSDGMLTKLTTDHSYVQMLVEQGDITEEEARNHPRRNEITRAIGMVTGVEFDFMAKKLRDNDKLLLCTDGLTGVCSDDEIKEVLDSCDDVKQCVNRLVNFANSNGGNDNITVVILEK